MPKLKNTTWTAEYVSPMHPDKICDRISDAVLAAHIAEDPKARVAVDVAGGHGTIFVVGEVTSSAKNVDVEQIVRDIAGNVEVIIRIAQQSPEIARGVDDGGAGDQGIMVGYACDETPELLPLEYALAKRLNEFLFERWPYDGKTQITIDNYQITAVVASFQHAPHDELQAAVEEWLQLINKTDGYEKHDLLGARRELYINPAGDWDIGGFDADSGLTGRKIVVDAYGPRVPVGGGAFSGKDLTKVDRSGAIKAREIAIAELQKSDAHEVTVYLAYAIGRKEPLQQTVMTKRY
jgi:S-adenosylmethionine synthetase